MARALLDEMPRLPRIIPVIGRAGREQRRVLDAGDSRRRDQQELRVPLDVFQYRVSAG
jgi:hypothetical protein